MAISQCCVILSFEPIDIVQVPALLVVCIQPLALPADRQTRQNELLAATMVLRVLITSVYGWRMVVHHGTAVLQGAS